MGRYEQWKVQLQEERKRGSGREGESERGREGEREGRREGEIVRDGVVNYASQYVNVIT